MMLAMPTVDGSRERSANSTFLRCPMGLATVPTWPCLIHVLRHHTARPVRNYEQALGICPCGRARRGTCSSRWKPCETTRSMREHARNMSKNCVTPKRSFRRSKRRASGMDESTTRKQTRIEQCKVNAKERSEKKRQATFDAM